MKALRIPGSFRDPSGFLFVSDGILYRQINSVYCQNFEQFMNSGLYDRLTKDGLLIRHEQASISPPDPERAYKVIKPEIVPFISYPYEWCFGQFKDAALLTLRVQQEALAVNLTLKDASAYNVQFRDGRPVIIDTLSFESYQAGQPWVAYRQFCQHFLAPLALMAYTDVRLSQLLRVFIDGLPLDLASRLLPLRSRLKLLLLFHLHLHAKSQQYFAHRTSQPTRPLSKDSLLRLLSSLTDAVEGLRWEPKGTEWANYYDQTNYSAGAFSHKQTLTGEFIERYHPASVWDLGANNGAFSQIASQHGAYAIALDSDPAAVEQLYRTCRAKSEQRILPLVVDLTNPSPSLGWQHHERQSLLDRGPADAIFALALVHHLAISNNVPLESIAEFLGRAGKTLLIEFIPKEDSQVQRLLATREDVFPDYRRETFEAAFRRHFTITRTEHIRNSQRIIYFMERKR